MPQTLLHRAATAALSLSVCASTVFATPATRPTTREIRQRVDDRELEAQMLGAMANDLFSRLGHRMTESQKRLGQEFDPGAETQEIQNRIVGDIDEMIDKLKPRNCPPAKPPEGEGPGVPADGRSVPGPQNASKTATVENKNPAAESVRPEGAPLRRTSTRLVEDAEAFLPICPRVGRDALIEGAGEEISEKYRAMTEAYYRAVAQRAGR